MVRPRCARAMHRAPGPAAPLPTLQRASRSVAAGDLDHSSRLRVLPGRRAPAPSMSALRSGAVFPRVETVSGQLRWRFAARLLVVLAGVLAIFAAYAVVSATGDRTWPTAPGKPLSQRFTGIVSPVPPSKAGVESGTSVLQRWIVTYEYEVSGQRYRGEATTQSPPTPRMVVYYHPEHPEISALDPGVDFLLVACSLGLSGVLFLASRFAYGAAGSTG